MRNDIIITEFSSFNDHLSVIDDIEASEQEREHQIGQVEGAPAEEPAKQAIHEETLYHTHYDTPDKEEGATLGIETDQTERCESRCGVDDSLEHKLRVDINQEVHGRANKPTHLEGQSCETTKSPILSIMFVGNLEDQVN